MIYFRQLLESRMSALILVRNYWRPKRKRTPYTKAIVFNSGDQVDSIKTYNPSEFTPGFEDIEELKNANETVKKLFSLEYQTNSKSFEKEMNEVVKSIQEHPADVKSIEVEIAKLTVLIRRGMKHCHINRHDGYSINAQLTRIEKRKNLLGQLKLFDLEKFYWLTRILKLDYKDPPQSEEEKADAALDRSKRGLRRLAAKQLADEMIRVKTERLKAKLKAEREKLEARKVEELGEIEREMRRLGLLGGSGDDAKLPPDLNTALTLLDHAHLIPKPKPELPEWKIIYLKKLEIFMPKKKVEDDRILKANGFLTNDEMPRYPDKDFY